MICCSSSTFNAVCIVAKGYRQMKNAEAREGFQHELIDGYTEQVYWRPRYSLGEHLHTVLSPYLCAGNGLTTSPTPQWKCASSRRAGSQPVRYATCCIIHVQQREGEGGIKSEKQVKRVDEGIQLAGSFSECMESKRCESACGVVVGGNAWDFMWCLFKPVHTALALLVVAAW